MSVRVGQHMARLRILWAAMLASLPVYAAVALFASSTAEAAADRGDALVWVLGALAAVNLVTVAPVLEAQLARARRAFAAGAGPESLLGGHQAAMLLAWARVEAVGVLGLVAYFTSGNTTYLTAFLAVAALGLLVLRPSEKPIRDLLATPSPAPPAPIEP